MVQCYLLIEAYEGGMWCARESWSWEHDKNFFSRVTTIWQSSMQKQTTYVYMVFKKSHHMALVWFRHIKEDLCKGFSKFSNNFPKHLNIKSEDHLIKPYLKHQLLRWACFPKYFCSQALRWEAWNKTYASQP